MILDSLDVKKIINTLYLASEKIMAVYRAPSSGVTIKEDDSPLTLADIRSHEVISKELTENFSNIPVLSEESKEITYQARKDWDYFWLVDPLDGTKEFIEKNDEFTVNIALMKKNQPLAGFIAVPVKGIIYYGIKSLGAFKVNKDKSKTDIKTKDFNNGSCVVVRSRSHPKDNEQTIIDKLGNTDIIHVGSSLKFCFLAEGRADIYLRNGPTMEWDTAAGQAVVEAAGGFMSRINTGLFSYNKELLKNSGFFCAGNQIIFDKVISIINKSF